MYAAQRTLPVPEEPVTRLFHPRPCSASTEATDTSMR
jgi:hypothetical protein